MKVKTHESKPKGTLASYENELEFCPSNGAAVHLYDLEQVQMVVNCYSRFYSFFSSVKISGLKLRPLRRSLKSKTVLS